LVVVETVVLHSSQKVLMEAIAFLAQSLLLAVAVVVPVVTQEQSAVTVVGQEAEALIQRTLVPLVEQHLPQEKVLLVVQDE
jgi:hypothetical protein